MKRLLTVLACLLGVWLAACSSAPVKPTPEHLSAGMEEMIKGIRRYNHGCYRESLDYFLEAHELFSAADQTTGVAMSLNNIGNVYRNMGDLDSALLFFEASLHMYTQLDDPQSRIQVMANQAAAHIVGGQFAEAAATLDQAEKIARARNITYVPLLSHRGALLTRTGDHPGAEKTLSRALAAVDPQNPAEVAMVHFALGDLLRATRRHAQAVDHFQTALNADRTAGFYAGIADDLAALGSTYEDQNQAATAVDFFQRSIKVYALIQNSTKVKSLLAKLETLSASSGQDIRVSLHFVNQWLKGEIIGSPCK